MSNGDYNELDDSQSDTSDDSNECDNTEYDYCEVADVCLSFENLNESEQFFEIRMTNNQSIKGFQLNFNEDIIITSFAGGVTVIESGFTPNAGDHTILAFTLSTNSIPPLQNQLLGQVYFSSVSDEMDISNIVFSDCDANPLQVDYSISF